MAGKLVKNWIVAFVGIFVLNILWHNVIFGGFYNEALLSVTNVVDGKPAPSIGLLILGMLVTSFAWAVVVPTLAKTKRQYISFGLLMAFATSGSFALFAKALFTTWTGPLAGMDLGYSVFSGILMGVILMWMNKKDFLNIAN